MTRYRLLWPGGATPVLACIVALFVVTAGVAGTVGAVPAPLGVAPATDDRFAFVSPVGDAASALNASTADVDPSLGTLDDPVLPDLSAALAAPTVGFGASGLQGVSLTNPTSLQFGPDDRLYVGVQSGLIYVYTVDRVGANDYVVTDTEVITTIKDIPNHDDDGTPNPGVTERLITGLLVVGTAENPVVYVSSSDPRIGGGDAGTDTDLDTNSGIISRLTWNGASWDHLELVRGLPRNEENHAPNGLQLDPATNTLYVAMGGNTNKGAPSNNFAYQPEYALSAAILSVDLDTIGETTYDLPTVQNTATPFGGDGGLNMAKLVKDGPVQIYSPGYRNPYDVVITESGRMYTVDNGANSGWGGTPVGDGTPTCTNQPNELSSATAPDSLHYVTGEGYYGGHPAPIRANPDGAGLYAPDGTLLVDFDASNTPVPFDMANPVECDYRPPGPDVGAGQNGALATFVYSTNGLEEYTALNFDGAMQGDLLAASFSTGGPIWRLVLSADGTQVVAKEDLFSNFGSLPLDVTAQGPGEVFPGTVWAATYGSDAITVFEPNDYAGGGITCTGADDPSLDEDGDGYSNADELDAGANPCSAASQPADNDGDFVSDVTDPDDDNDGRPDTTDPFAVDADDGRTTALPVDYQFQPGTVAGTILDLGFTGLMVNGADYLTLYDPEALTAGGAANVLSIDEAGEGTAVGSANDLTQGFQFGVAPGEDPFVVHTTLQAPFPASDDGVTPVDDQAQGVYIGTGDQANYASLLVTANGGNGGVEFRVEQNDAQTHAVEAAAPAVVGDGKVVDLYLTTDPTTGVVTASYTVGGGTRIPVGTTTVPTAWVTDPTQGLAVGVMATSNGPAGPFPATWSQLQVLPTGATDTGEATVGVKAGNTNIDTSTYPSNSFQVTNTGGQAIESVTFDVRSSTIPDLVFDPDGTAGDVVAKPFTLDTEGGTGFVGHDLSVPHDGSSDDGYDVLSTTFTDFGPGETVGFSIDMDPTSIKGVVDPGPGESGSVSGLELTGSRVVVTFADGSTHTATLFSDGSQGGATTVVGPGLAAAPTIDAVGVFESPTSLSPGHSAATVTTAEQAIEVSGPTGATVRLLHLQAGLFTAGVPNGGYDLEAYEANSVVALAEQSATIGASGTVSVPVTLARTDDATDLNYFVAVVEGVDTGPTSNVVILEYDPAATVPTAAFTYDPATPAAGQSVSFDGTVSSDPDGTIASYAWDFGDGTTATGATPTHTFAASGSYVVSLTVTDDDGNTAATSQTVGVVDPDATTVFAVNAGGAAYTAADGTTYLADTGFVGGKTYTVATAAIVGTSDDPLYQSERYGTSFGYSVPVQSGDYAVTLKFAEIYWTVDGKRVFGVTAEGKQIVSNLDLHATVGHDAAYDVTVPVTVTDGTLDLSFASTVDSAKVSAIRVDELGGTANRPPTAAFTSAPASPAAGESVSFDASGSSDGDGTVAAYAWTFGDGATATGVAPSHTYASAGTYTVTLTVTDDDGAQDQVQEVVTVSGTTGDGGFFFAVNAGGGSYTATDGKVYASDTAFTGGSTFSTTDPIGGTNDDPVYQTERYGTFSYAVPVPAGDYDLALQFAEIWFTTDGSRVFGATAEGQPVVSNLDLHAVAGHDVAYDVTVPVTVTDGTLNLAFTGSVDNAKLAGFRVVGTDSTGGTPNDPPSAAFTYSPTDPVAGESVTFDATGSDDVDGTIVSYAWAFGDGDLASGQSLTHTYAAPGTYTVTLTVTDDDGATGVTQTSVTVTDGTTNAAPTAAFTYSPASPAAGESVTFDASGSGDSDGTLVSYVWTFGDGDTGSGVNPAHTYASAGTYTVALTVTDDGGLTGTTSTTVTVSDGTTNAAPTAAFTYAPTDPEPGESVSFDASGSGDSDGTLVSYTWTFGDGASGSGVNPAHTYASAGTYTVTLTVTDDDGATDTTQTTVSVTDPAISDVVFAVNAGGGAYTAGDGTVYAADAGFSGGSTFSTTDPIAGTTDDPLYKSERYGAFSYAVPLPDGDYTVTLKFAEIWFTTDGSRVFGITAEGKQVVSNLDLHATVGHDVAYDVTVPVTVTDGTLNLAAVAGVNNPKLSAVVVASTGGVSNVAPTASFTSAPGSPSAGESVSFDAGGSSDSDGTIVSYAWTFGDGDTATSVSPTHTYASAGTYTVTLTVTDDGGATGTASKTITVVSGTTNAKPTAAFTYAPTSPTSGETVTFDASGSSDADGTIATYAWTFGDGTTATGVAPGHTYASAGTYTVALTVTDDDGATDTTQTTVTVSDPGSGVVFAVNAGGGAYTAGDGTVYAADAGFSGGSTYATTDPIAGTIDDPLYKSERYGTFSYAVAVPDGDYTVTLKFAEIWWTADGKRVFGATAEGQSIVSGLDLHAVAGQDAAYDVTVPVTVTDGTLNLAFAASVDNAKVSAILVESA